MCKPVLAELRSSPTLSRIGRYRTRQKSQLIGIGELCYWDVKGVKPGEEIDIKVKYTDILDNPRPVLKFQITV